MREQGVGLKDRVDLPPVGRRLVDELAADADLAGRGCSEAADQTERRRLATSRRTEQAEELPVLNLQVDRVKRCLRAVTLGDPGELDRRSAHCSVRRVGVTSITAKRAPRLRRMPQASRTPALRAWNVPAQTTARMMRDRVQRRQPVDKIERAPCPASMPRPGLEQHPRCPAARDISATGPPLDAPGAEEVAIDLLLISSPLRRV